MQLSLLILAMFGCSASQPGNDVWTERGPHGVDVETDVGPGAQFTVFRPADLSQGGPHPLVLWSVGTGGHPTGNGALLSHWASHGFVVVGGDDENQANGAQALAALAWVDAEVREGQPWNGLVDAERVVVSGHSQGGNAALHVALASDRVDSVLPIQPGGGDEGGFLDAADDSQLIVPVFYICGERDGVVPPERCKERFAAAPAPAWIGVVKKVGHFVVATDKPDADNIHVRRYTTRWLLGRLRADEQAFSAFLGEPGDLAEDAAWTWVDRKL